MKKVIEKTANLDLVGVNGNAYMIMGVFRRQAKKEGWTQTEIDLVINEAKSGDYNHLLATIVNHCEANEKESIDPKEVWSVLEQLGLQTHYLASKVIADWDSYDYSNYRSLQRKAGKSKKVFAIFDADVLDEDKYAVTTKPPFFFETKEEAEEELQRICIETKRSPSDFIIHTLWKLPK